MASNFIPDRKIHMQETCRDELWDIVHKKLPPLHHERLTNHLGVSAIVLTDIEVPIIIHRRGIRYHSFSGTWAAGVSGSVIAEDFGNLHQNFAPRIFRADPQTFGPGEQIEFGSLTPNELINKLEGRTALLPTDRAILRLCWQDLKLTCKQIHSILLIGIAREFRRIGKPEFFYLIRTSLPDNSSAEVGEEVPWRPNSIGPQMPRVVMAPLPRALPAQKVYWLNKMADDRFSEVDLALFYFAWRYCGEQIRAKT